MRRWGPKGFLWETQGSRGAAGWLAIALCAFVALYGLWLLAAMAGLVIGGTDNQRAVSDAAALPIGIAAAGFAFRASRKAALSDAARRAWGRIALAELGYTTGSALWMYFEVVVGERPFPSIADAAYLTFYPLLAWALLTFPVAQTAGRDRWKFSLDIALVLVGSGTLVWYFILLPVSGGRDPLTVALTLTYPLLDLALLASVMGVLARQPERGSRAALGTFVAGLSLFVTADLFFGYLSLEDAYTSGSVVDGLWILGLLLMALGAHRQYIAAKPDVSAEAREEPTVTWGVWWLPYSAVCAAYALLVALMRNEWDQPQGGVLLGAVALTALVVVRQASAQHEHARLYRAARQELVRRKELEAALEYQAHHDALTGLPNRRFLHDRLGLLLSATAPTQCEPFALALLDLDGFKEINDTLGHHVGDELLSVVARRLEGAVRGCDTVARMGGDEFAVLMPDTVEVSAMSIARRLLASLAVPVELEGNTISVQASLGIALYPEHGASDSVLLRRADAAMYVAKRLGRGYAFACDDDAPPMRKAS